MARPIQDTPIIKGEDAKRFYANLRRALIDKQSPEKAKERQKHQEEMEDMYNKMVKATNGVFF